MIKSIGKRWLSLLLALTLIFGMLPQIMLEVSAADLNGHGVCVL